MKKNLRTEVAEISIVLDDVRSRLFKADLWKTYQKVEEVMQSLGYEAASKIKTKK